MTEKQIGISNNKSISNYDRTLLKNTGMLKIYGVVLIVFGFGGICIGAYSLAFRVMSQDALPLLYILIMFSIGFSFFGWLFYKMADFIAKIKNELENKTL